MTQARITTTEAPDTAKATIRTDPAEARHLAAVDLLHAACKVYLAGCGQMRNDVRVSLDAELAEGGTLEVRVTILPNPIVQVVCERVGGEERLLFSFAMPIETRPAIQ